MARTLFTASPLDFDYGSLLGMGSNGFAVTAKTTVRRQRRDLLFVLSSFSACNPESFL